MKQERPNRPQTLESVFVRRRSCGSCGQFSSGASKPSHGISWTVLTETFARMWIRVMWNVGMRKYTSTIPPLTPVDSRLKHLTILMQNDHRRSYGWSCGQFSPGESKPSMVFRGRFRYIDIMHTTFVRMWNYALYGMWGWENRPVQFHPGRTSILDCKICLF